MRLALVIAVLCAAASAAAQPLGEWHTPATLWYDIERYEVRGSGLRYELNVPSLDGYRSRLVIYPSKNENARRLVLFVPDLYTTSHEHLGELVAGMRDEFHAAFFVPRGHRPVVRTKLHGAKTAAELTKNREQVAALLHDFRAVLGALKDTAQILGNRSDSICLVAGDFYSNLLMTESLPGVDCLVLLSPNRKFYRKDLSEVASMNLTGPVFLIAAKFYAYELTDFAAKLPRARLRLVSGAGNGYNMIYTRQDIADDLRRFLREPEQFVMDGNAVPLQN